MRDRTLPICHGALLGIDFAPKPSTRRLCCSATKEHTMSGKMLIALSAFVLLLGACTETGAAPQGRGIEATEQRNETQPN